MEQASEESSVSRVKCSDFSIARILGSRTEDVVTCQDKQEQPQRFEWLQCTRYKPPRLPRSRRREGAQRRKLGRNPRIPFSSAQVSVLEQRFRRGHYLSSVDVVELAAFLSLSETRVKIWFQNRRARERRDREVHQQQQQLSNEPQERERSNSPQPATLTQAHRFHQQLLCRMQDRSAFVPVLPPFLALRSEAAVFPGTPPRFAAVGSTLRQSPGT